MKYLKYFENLETNTEPQIKEGQHWLSKDGKLRCIILKIHENLKRNNIDIHLIGVEGESNFGLSRKSVDQEYILNSFDLLDANYYKDVNLDFNKTTYIPEDKSIIGCYFIVDKTDKIVKILNIKEHIITRHSFMDNAKAYSISPYYVTLPLSQIEILYEDKHKKNFFYIKIPYWLYRKNSDGLEIIRIANPLKRYSYNRRDLKNPNILDALKQGHLYDYIKYSNLDKTSLSYIAELQMDYKRSLSQ